MSREGEAPAEPFVATYEARREPRLPIALRRIALNQMRWILRCRGGGLSEGLAIGRVELRRQAFLALGAIGD